MPAPRTPTNILELRGSFKKDPQRRKAHATEPVDTRAPGEPPERLSEAERTAWAEISSNCSPGVLVQSDRLAIEVTSRLLAELWETGQKFHNAKLRVLRSMLMSFGMIPSDRSKVSVPKPEAVNPFAKFL